MSDINLVLQFVSLVNLSHLKISMEKKEVVKMSLNPCGTKDVNFKGFVQNLRLKDK